jgi:hypothetical protein
VSFAAGHRALSYIWCIAFEKGGLDHQHISAANALGSLLEETSTVDGQPP